MIGDQEPEDLAILVGFLFLAAVAIIGAVLL